MSLIINSLSKQYPNNERFTLKEINIEIDDGEFVCIVGQSGCGKSTLLNIVAGLEKPTSGQVILEGEVVTEPGADRGVMFQEDSLFPWLNVIDNVKIGMKIAGVPKSEQEKKASYYLEMVGLLDYKYFRIHQLSGGMKQRVALARLLTLDSKMLLMDEPFSALDKQTSNGLREELLKIWKKTRNTVLYITHSVEEAIYFADRVVVMSPKTCGIIETIQVDMSRPRNVYSTKFVDLRHQILDLVRGE